MSKKSRARFEVSQGAVIQNPKGEVLILKLHNSSWVLPGGHLDDNEDWFDGLCREIREETGITDLEVKGILGISSFGDSYGVCFHCTVPTVSKNGLALSQEHDAFAWVGSMDELAAYEFYHPTLRDCALKVLEK